MGGFDFLFAFSVKKFFKFYSNLEFLKSILGVCRGQGHGQQGEDHHHQRPEQAHPGGHREDDQRRGKVCRRGCQAQGREQLNNEIN